MLCWCLPQIKSLLLCTGIVPQINASIVLQLLSTTFPNLKKLQREEGPMVRHFSRRGNTIGEQAKCHLALNSKAGVLGFPGPTYWLTAVSYDITWSPLDQ